MSKGTILITGASSGLGAEMARQFADLGYDLAITARRTDRLDELAAEITAKHADRKILTKALDVTDDDAEFDKEIVLDASEMTPFVTWGTNPGQGVPLGGSVPSPDDFTDPGDKVAAEKALQYMGLGGGSRLGVGGGGLGSGIGGGVWPARPRGSAGAAAATATPPGELARTGAGAEDIDLFTGTTADQIAATCAPDQPGGGPGAIILMHVTQEADYRSLESLVAAYKADGYEFVTRMHGNPETADVPVIFYTATYREREAVAVAQSCGVRWVLPKPSDPDVIMSTVQEALGMQGGAVTGFAGGEAAGVTAEVAANGTPAPAEASSRPRTDLRTRALLDPSGVGEILLIEHLLELRPLARRNERDRERHAHDRGLPAGHPERRGVPLRLGRRLVRGADGQRRRRHTGDMPGDSRDKQGLRLGERAFKSTAGSKTMSPAAEFRGDFGNIDRVTRPQRDTQLPGRHRCPGRP